MAAGLANVPFIYSQPPEEKGWHQCKVALVKVRAPSLPKYSFMTAYVSV